MLIKLQKTRFSPEYFIFDRISNITYRAAHYRFFTRDQIISHMQSFLSSGLSSSDAVHRSCWYQIDHADAQVCTDKFPDGYGINAVSFTDKDGRKTELRFDGECFICNDDGKTVQSIKAGGHYPPAPHGTLTGDRAGPDDLPPIPPEQSKPVRIAGVKSGRP